MKLKLLIVSLALFPFFADAKTIDITISSWHLNCFKSEPDFYIANLLFFKQKEAGIYEKNYLFQATSDKKDLCEKVNDLLPTNDPNTSPKEIEIPVEMTFLPATTYYKSDVTGSKWAPRPACFLITHREVEFRTQNGISLISKSDQWDLKYYGYCQN